jgi:predicted ATP-dependent endonuclease of OLD family
MEIRKHRQSTVFLIEEPDAFMHPGLQKNFLEYMLEVSRKPKPGHQFFISTHSPYLLDFAVRSDQHDARPHVYRIFKQDGHSCLRFLNPGDRSADWDTLHDLGHSSADVLHPNGIIWVEGPSDKIYLRTWLECFTQKNGKKINWGVDCDILWYGGSNLAHLDVDYWENVEEEDIEKLLHLLTINPHAAVVVDRDGFPNDKMTEHKRTVKEHCEKEGILFWMTKEGKRTIEDYIPDNVKERAKFTRGGSKVDNARKYQKWAKKGRHCTATLSLPIAILKNKSDRCLKGS